MPIGTDAVALFWGLHCFSEGPAVAGQARQQGPVSVSWPTCTSPLSAFEFTGSAGAKMFGKVYCRITRTW
jgi:hypothetical protein